MSEFIDIATGLLIIEMMAILFQVLGLSESEISRSRVIFGVI